MNKGYISLHKYCYLFTIALLFNYSVTAQKNVFPIVTKASRITIVYNNNAPKLDSISANLLAADIERVTSFKPTVTTDFAKVKGNIIVIGAYNSAIIQKLLKSNSAFSKKAKWQMGMLWIYHN